MFITHIPLNVHRHFRSKQLFFFFFNPGPHSVACFWSEQRIRITASQPPLLLFAESFIVSLIYHIRLIHEIPERFNILYVDLIIGANLSSLPLLTELYVILRSSTCKSFHIAPDDQREDLFARKAHKTIGSVAK